MPSPVAVRSRAQVDLVKAHMAVVNQGPSVFNGQAGAIVRVNVAGEQTGSTNAKGISQLASPLSFTDVLAGMPAGTTLVTPGNCFIPAGVPSAGSAAGVLLQDVGSGRVRRLQRWADAEQETSRDR